jgi:hypothetical protein
MAKMPRPKATRVRKTGWRGEPKKSEVVTLRVPYDMLQAADEAPRGKRSAFMLDLMRRGLEEKQRASRDAPVRGLCAAIERLSALICNKVDETTGKPEFNWLTHPFMFRAFQLAVQGLMDVHAPAGDVIPPEVHFDDSGLRWPRVAAATRGPYDTPENRAAWAVDVLLNAMMASERWIKAPEHFGHDIPADMASGIERDNRELFLIREALTPKPEARQSKKT